MCGATKIQYASSQCKKEGLRYIWIDTCCIDKSSSAELSEAIDSMYGWYEGSVVCYAYLEDVGRALSTQTSYGPSNKDKTVEESRWFTRGWTLQELIAPAKVDFSIINGNIWAERRTSLHFCPELPLYQKMS
jgi:hypothetical protein